MPAIAKDHMKQDVETPETDAKTILQWLSDDSIVLIDVRETTEYEQEHIAGAFLCPLSMFDANVFPKFAGKTIVLHCAVGKRSAAAAKQLIQAGYVDVINMAGGLQSWKASGCPTEAQLNTAETGKQFPYLDLPKFIKPAVDTELAPHPGYILEREFLIPLGISRIEFAGSTGISPARISAIIQEDTSVTAEYAMRLARNLCTSDEFWMRLQSAYDLAQARKIHQEIIHNEVRPYRSVSST